MQFIFRIIDLALINCSILFFLSVFAAQPTHIMITISLAPVRSKRIECNHGYTQSQILEECTSLLEYASGSRSRWRLNSE